MANNSVRYRSKYGAVGRKAKVEKTNKIGLLLITLVALGCVVFIWTRMDKASDRIKELDKEIERLEQEYDEQQKRAISLEERKAYVQTKKYIEDVARRLGLVYPDEIIYKPSK